MILKKQTVWLLTMLSLVVVLSVYYVTTPQPTSDEMALEEGKKDDQTASLHGKATETAASKSGDTTISSVASDELFTALRLELEAQTEARMEELETVMASNTQTAQNKNKAYEEYKELQAVAKKAHVLETMIRAKGFEDALVSADGDNVIVYVKTSKETSASVADDIMLLVMDELGKDKRVAVEFQPVQ